MLFPLMKILCIDDESGVLLFLNAALSKEHEVTTACCGEEGLTAFRNEGPFPIVITDIQMPDMSGFDVVNQVKFEIPSTVCMLITGQADFNYSSDAVEEGKAEKCLLKPLVLKDLRKAVQECVDLANERTQSSYMILAK